MLHVQLLNYDHSEFTPYFHSVNVTVTLYFHLANVIVGVISPTECCEMTVGHCLAGGALGFRYDWRVPHRSLPFGSVQGDDATGDSVL